MSSISGTLCLGFPTWVAPRIRHTILTSKPTTKPYPSDYSARNFHGTVLRCVLTFLQFGLRLTSDCLDCQNQNGRQGEICTHDPPLRRRVLYLLSYPSKLVARTGIEPVSLD